jgi:protein gp37
MLIPGAEQVVVGDEPQKRRPLGHNWVLDIRVECRRQGAYFEFPGKDQNQ